MVVMQKQTLQSTSQQPMAKTVFGWMRFIRLPSNPKD
jgi:hypothetical protein